ncbi:L-galactose dehydrogenase [Gaeumannomyces tritici R3-111a-1]|uniref:L-galactose dehydrogenase n=1 Tax=Gaeumannomyces tritici (strain R3-111a-1) TaxID=644352 RepID=J3NQW8_GAET3|nr:L-galactose dehydrogenase [Gaeumannomyces tritici R3-111a-1]EJT78574.1 L-galactose dehydrogenase [Gaeumannomyces tritici R3-111a-1]
MADYTQFDFQTNSRRHHSGLRGSRPDRKVLPWTVSFTRGRARLKLVVYSISLPFQDIDPRSFCLSNFLPLAAFSATSCLSLFPQADPPLPSDLLRATSRIYSTTPFARRASRTTATWIHRMAGPTVPRQPSAPRTNGHGHNPSLGDGAVEPIALSAVLPPLILGTATFNTQYVHDPTKLPVHDIIRRAFELGIRAFDTSPYYGPAEILLGEAISAAVQGGDGSRGSSNGANDVQDQNGHHGQPQQQQQPPPPRHPRASYLLISKAGRVGPASFDYSPAAITASVYRSLERLRTPYLDLVYLHDVEFVTDADVLGAMPALWDLQRRGKIRHVGISGYPIPRLLDLAEKIAALGRSGGGAGAPEPAPGSRALDAILSYCHCTVQNTALTDPATLARFRAAGVDVVLNASIVAMGLLAPSISVGPQGAWHPAPEGLRAACVDMRAAVAAQGGGSSSSSSSTLARIAIRFALETWGRAAAVAGLAVGGGGKVGATVIGVTTVEELEETVEEWRGVVEDLGLRLHQPAVGEEGGLANGRSCRAAIDASGGHTEAAAGPSAVGEFVRRVLWPILGDWRDYSWESPPQGWFVTHPNGNGT